MTDWIDVDERDYGNDRWDGTNEWELLKHAAEADRRIAKRDKRIVDLGKWTAELERQVEMFRSLLAERDKRIENMQTVIEQLTEADHCCQMYSDLSGVPVEHIKRTGSCGCVQAKEQLAERDRRIADLEWQDAYNWKEYERRIAQRDRLIDELETDHRQQLAERDELIRDLATALKAYGTCSDTGCINLIGNVVAGQSYCAACSALQRVEAYRKKQA